MENKMLRRGSVFKDVNLLILICTVIGTILILFFLLGSKYFSATNFQSMAYQIPEFGFISLAMMVCMLTGGIDLSVVSTTLLSAILGAIFMNNSVAAGMETGTAIFLTVLIVLGISILCGLFNGILIAKLSILPILVTLTTMILYSGISLAITAGAGVTGFPDEFIKFATEKVAQVPLTFILFIIAAIVMGIVISWSKFGRKVYLYGENSTVALFSGINNNKVIMTTYTLSGFLCGIAAIIMMARVNSARVGYGDTYQLQAILVCALGGVNPNGGRGKVLGVVIAIIVLQMLQSGFTLLSFAPYIKSLIWGSVLVAVMMVDYIIRTKREKASRI
jgi:simple sugar transport system permease protein